MSRIIAYLALPIGLMVISAILVLTQDPQPPKNNGIPIGGKFELVGIDGQLVTEKTYYGKKTIVFFGFTHCPHVCPTSLFTLTQALNALGKDAENWRVLFITIDPERDTKEIMERYVSTFHKNIVGLTGSPKQIKNVTKAYAAYYAKEYSPQSHHMSDDKNSTQAMKNHDISKNKEMVQEMNYTMIHTTSFYLMHSNGVFKNIVEYQTPVEELVRQMKEVL